MWFNTRDAAKLNRTFRTSANSSPVSAGRGS